MTGQGSVDSLTHPPLGGEGASPGQGSVDPLFRSTGIDGHSRFPRPSKAPADGLLRRHVHGCLAVPTVYRGNLYKLWVASLHMLVTLIKTPTFT